MKVIKDYLTIDEKDGVLNYMLEQENSVLAEYVLTAALLDLCTDEDMRIYDEKGEDFEFNFDKVDEYAKEVKTQLADAYKEMLWFYSNQIVANNTKTLEAVVTGFIEQMNSINADDLTEQFKTMMVQLQENG